MKRVTSSALETITKKMYDKILFSRRNEGWWWNIENKAMKNKNKRYDDYVGEAGDEITQYYIIYTYHCFEERR